MTAYLIVDVAIRDPQRYEDYKQKVPALIARHGGEYLVRGGRHETMEGDWQPHRVAVLRFPSYEQAKAFYDDAHYRGVRQHRAGATEYFNMVLVEGVAAPV